MSLNNAQMWYLHHREPSYRLRYMNIPSTLNVLVLSAIKGDTVCCSTFLAIEGRDQGQGSLKQANNDKAKCQESLSVRLFLLNLFIVEVFYMNLLIFQPRIERQVVRENSTKILFRSGDKLNFQCEYSLRIGFRMDCDSALMCAHYLTRQAQSYTGAIFVCSKKWDKYLF